VLSFAPLSLASSEGSAFLITISWRAPRLPSIMVTVREPGGVEAGGF
jgi:hypothetical protein